MSHTFRLFASFLLLCSVFLINACAHQTKNKHTADANAKAFMSVLQTHLNAVTNKDIDTLASTLSTTAGMQLILPQTEIIVGVEGFLDYHRQWFAIDNGWTFETRVLNSQVEDQLGMAVVEIVYREPIRNGQPYFNRMIVSYDLRKINGQWFIFKDHASSVEKSTDKKAES